jgi:hypothetical protein
MVTALQDMTGNSNELLQVALSQAPDPTQFEANLTDAAAMLDGRVQVTVSYEGTTSRPGGAPATDEPQTLMKVPCNLRQLWDTPPASLLDLLPPLYVSLDQGTYQTGGSDRFGLRRSRVRAESAIYSVWQLSPYAWQTASIATAPAPHMIQIPAAGAFPAVRGRFNWNWTRFAGTWGGSRVVATCSNPWLSGICKWSELPDPTISGVFPNQAKMKALLYGDLWRVIVRYRSIVVRAS